jgi:gluconate kinase
MICCVNICFCWQHVRQILTLKALQDRKNVIVDGSLRDYAWYSQYLASLREKYPTSKLAIIHVTASPNTALARAEQREHFTGNTTHTMHSVMCASPRVCYNITYYWGDLN